MGVPGMFGLAEHEHIARVVASAGFDELQLEALDLPFALGPLDDACAFGAEVGVVRAVLDGLEPAARAEALESLRALAPTTVPTASCSNPRCGS
jgi:hypothetical protein